MPRAPRARQADVAERIRLFAEHHIVAVRTARRNGEIVAVKHMAWGWMSPRTYYLLQEIHRILPEIVQGGYRAKSLLWGMSAELTVVGTSVSLPLGLLFPLLESIGFNDAINAGNASNAFYWGLALFAPFGDVLAIKTILDVISTGGFQGLKDVIDAGVKKYIGP